MRTITWPNGQLKFIVKIAQGWCVVGKCTDTFNYPFVPGIQRIQKKFKGLRPSMLHGRNWKRWIKLAFKTLEL